MYNTFFCVNTKRTLVRESLKYNEYDHENWVRLKYMYLHTHFPEVQYSQSESEIKW